MADRGLLDLAVNRIPGLMAREKLLLCEKFDREDDFYLLSRGDIVRIINRPLGRPWTMDMIRSQAEKDAALAKLRGIGYVAHGDGNYPPLLRELYDPPALIFYRGVLPDRERPLAAVVGTRRPSAAAAAQAFAVGREFGRAGLAVVSGLALGIDAMAHRGNLAGGGATVAVLGCGLDRVYPVANRDLARRVLAGGGVLLGEYPPGTEPFRWNFPARNRIIAGLARGVLIVEAPARSGALVTAQFALDLGRDLLVASSGVASSLGAGTRRLRDEGARTLERAADMFAEWGVPRPGDGQAERETVADLARSLARSLSIECEE
jgi:DNA processing protein